MRSFIGGALVLTLAAANGFGEPQPPAGPAQGSSRAAELKDALQRRWRGLSLRLRTGSTVEIIYPRDGTLFPSDIRSPELRWDDYDPGHKAWLLRFEFSQGAEPIEASSAEKRWTPTREAWERIKAASLEKPARLTVYGLEPGKVRPRQGASIRLTTSRDPVGAPIFFRAVPTPFPTARHYVKVKWKLGWVSSYDRPRTVMEKQRLCFNCHVMSLNGRTLGFEMNPRDFTQESRGGYLVVRDPGKDVVWRRENFFDWNDAATAQERQNPGLQGFVSIVSPDGLFVMTSGKALTSITLNPCHDLGAEDPSAACQGMYDYQLITQGVLLTYSLKDKKIRPLPGGDDPKFIQVPSSWSPDGKTIYLLRAPITPQLEKLNREPLPYEVYDEQLALLTRGAQGVRDLDKIYPLKYDLYAMPFNDGKGGTPTPVAGASHNGRSNYTAKISPDGKWIAFTQSANGVMFLRPDSEVFLIPAAGGKPRRLQGNGPGGNSWHSWSPNGRWLVFSSKAYGPKTDMVLTHIDENGADSPPVVLTSLRDETGLAANLPEFFNIKPGQLERLEPRVFAPR